MGEREEPLLITRDMLAGGEIGHEGLSGRVDFERGMHHTPPLVLLLIATNVVLFVREITTGALASREHLIQAGALTREAVLAGEWWRLLSATFLHGGWDHLIGNCLVLYIVGMGCEHAFGAARTAFIYLVSGLSGSIVSTLFTQGPSVGASGAIFGVVAAVVVTLYRHRDRFYLRDNRIAVVLGIWSLYQIVTGFLTPYIDNSAHLGGLAGGAVASLLLTPRLLSERPPS
jgi:rhomboid protease GluP